MLGFSLVWACITHMSFKDGHYCSLRNYQSLLRLMVTPPVAWKFTSRNEPPDLFHPNLFLPCSILYVLGCCCSLLNCLFVWLVCQFLQIRIIWGEKLLLRKCISHISCRQVLAAFFFFFLMIDVRELAYEEQCRTWTDCLGFYKKIRSVSHGDQATKQHSSMVMLMPPGACIELLFQFLPTISCDSDM